MGTKARNQTGACRTLNFRSKQWSEVSAPLRFSHSANKGCSLAFFFEASLCLRTSTSHAPQLRTSIVLSSLARCDQSNTMDTDSPPSTPPPQQPSLPWRIGAAMVMGFVGSTSRLFMFGANKIEVHGLDKFLETLDRRKDPEGRERGLITGTLCPQYLDSGERNSDKSISVSNHTCVYVRITVPNPIRNRGS